MVGDFVLRSYQVDVDGFPPALFHGSSAGQARARAWRAWSSAWNGPFKEFLKISSVRRCGDPPDFGTPILVGGKAAFQAGAKRGNQVPFVRPGCDIIMLSHELDVSAPSTE